MRSNQRVCKFGGLVPIAFVLACLGTSPVYAEDEAHGTSPGLSIDYWGGAIGDALPEALKARSERSGERFIVTQQAQIKERQVGTRAFLDSESRSVVIRGWTLIYSRDEDISSVEATAKQNLHVLDRKVGRTLSHPQIKTIEWPGTSLETLNRVFFAICKVPIQIVGQRPVYVFVIDARGRTTEKEEFCRDYGLFLAASNVVITDRDGRIVAKTEQRM